MTMLRFQTTGLFWYDAPIYNHTEVVTYSGFTRNTSQIYKHIQPSGVVTAKGK